MKIIHLLKDGLFKAANVEELKQQIEEMYSSNGFRPQVSIEKDMVIVDFDDEQILRFDSEFQNASALCSKGQFAEARTILNHIVKDCPSYSEAYRLLAQLEMGEGNVDAAIDLDLDALKHDPRNIWALVLMGNLFTRFKDDLSTAMKYYSQVLEYDPENAIAMCNIGAVLLEKGNNEESFNYFDKALEVNPTYANAYYGKIMAAQRLGFGNAAFDIALEGVKKSKQLPENPAIREELIKLMLSIAKDLVKESNFKPLCDKVVDEIKRDCGCDIVIVPDSSLDVYAKLEYGPARRRKNHIVRYNPNKPYVEHLLMHELMHLRMAVDNAAIGKGQVVTSSENQVRIFNQRYGKLFRKLHPNMEPDKVNQMLDSIRTGLCLQLMNCPLDLFVEDVIFEKYPEMRPLQLLSLSRQEEDNIGSSTNPEMAKLFPADIVHANRVMNMVTSLHYKKLFGIDFIKNYHPKKLEYEQAKDMFDEYEAYVETFNTADEYELMMYFAESLKMDDLISLEAESQLSHENEFNELVDSIYTGETQPSPEEITEINNDFANRHKDGEDAAQTTMMSMYMLSAMKDFNIRPYDEVRMTAMEMAMVSTKGISPEGKYKIPSYPGKEFSGWEFLAYYYVSCAQTLPELLSKLGLPFDTAYGMAKKMFEGEK